jgi:hypothetical protein
LIRQEAARSGRLLFFRPGCEEQDIPKSVKTGEARPANGVAAFGKGEKGGDRASDLRREQAPEQCLPLSKHCKRNTP